MSPPLRLAAIEYLRGLAALAVLGFHSLSTADAAALHPVLQAARAVLIHGWLGVHVFFALSGWCIAERLAAAHRRSETPAAFLNERALRIFPSYWAALALSIFLLALAASFNGIPFARHLPATPAAWLIELSLTQPAFGRPALLIVSWTLFHELTFYASACALVLRQRGVPAATLLILGAAVCLLVTALRPTGPLAGFAFWSHFFVGVLAWWSFHRPLSAAWHNAAWLAALLAAPVALALEWSAAALVAGATALALAVAARHPPSLPSALALPLTVLGAASYSLYLIHVAVLSPYFNLAGRAVSPSSATFLVVWLTGLGLAVAAGLAFHHGIERPCERWRRRLVARPAAA